MEYQIQIILESLPNGYTIKEIMKGHASISYNYNLANVFIKQTLLKTMDTK